MKFDVHQEEESFN